MKKLILIPLMLGLNACTSSYTFNSNVDSAAIKEYFKASNVTLFERGQFPSKNYQQLGLVEGESCQIAINDKPAELSQARTKARRHAADLGANALLVKHCAVINTRSAECITQVICSGLAVKIND
ncbi:MAG: Rcs stress response system protein RcsF [Parashewanella sp.]